jgi:hypothetical protein
MKVIQQSVVALRLEPGSESSCLVNGLSVFSGPAEYLGGAQEPFYRVFLKRCGHGVTECVCLDSLCLQISWSSLLFEKGFHIFLCVLFVLCYCLWK